MLLALQANPLFARAIEKILFGTGFATVSIKKILTINTKSIGATAITFGAVHSIGGTGSSAIEM